jgi:hypothetical protein
LGLGGRPRSCTTLRDRAAAAARRCSYTRPRWRRPRLDELVMDA